MQHRKEGDLPPPALRSSRGAKEGHPHVVFTDQTFSVAEDIHNPVKIWAWIELVPEGR